MTLRACAASPPPTQGAAALESGGRGRRASPAAWPPTLALPPPLVTAAAGAAGGHDGEAVVPLEAGYLRCYELKQQRNGNFLARRDAFLFPHFDVDAIESWWRGPNNVDELMLTAKQRRRVLRTADPLAFAVVPHAAARWLPGAADGGRAWCGGEEEGAAGAGTPATSVVALMPWLDETDLATAARGICAARRAFGRVVVAACEDTLSAGRAAALAEAGSGRLARALVGGGAVAVSCADDAGAAEQKRSVAEHRGLRLRLGLLGHAQVGVGHCDYQAVWAPAPPGSLVRQCGPRRAARPRLCP